MPFLSLSITFPRSKPILQPDKCKCSGCSTIFNVADCYQEHGHHDGYEMPAYTEILCSVCEDGGCIDDFWFSDRIEKDYLVTINKLSWQILDQWYAGLLVSGQICKVREVYHHGVLAERSVSTPDWKPIPKTHYTILRIT